MPRPLSHIRVLDLSRVLAGPWASQNLADLGAEVIKIERPGTGDDTRGWGPPWIKDRDGKDTSDSAYFLSCNRGKKSVTLDISKPEGQQIVRDLAAQCDVLIENYKVGTFARYGLGYEQLRQLNPRLIYCSITGFGQSGPYAPRPGYDFVFQGMGGLMSITGERDDLPGGGPMKVGIAITDIITAMYASLAITAAIAHCERGGSGQFLDMALLDSMVAFNANQISNYFVSGDIPRRYGNAHANVVPYQVFPCQDGHIILAIGNDSQFASFCNVAGRPELAADPRFRLMSGRIVNRGALIPLIADIMRTRGMHEWIKVLEAANVPCGPINNMQQVFEDPQVQHRALKVEIPTAAGPPSPSVASPMRFSETPVEYTVPPPTLGQHTREILHGLLGMEQTAIDALAAKGIV
ncbi:MAG: CoA transferase [Betaproteobacteria bacterium]|nr:MAG: CoA transferase [Betaproteobacteria bacterium]